MAHRETPISRARLSSDRSNAGTASAGRLTVVLAVLVAFLVTGCATTSPTVHDIRGKGGLARLASGPQVAPTSVAVAGTEAPPSPYSYDSPRAATTVAANLSSTWAGGGSHVRLSRMTSTLPARGSVAGEDAGDEAVIVRGGKHMRSLA